MITSIGDRRNFEFRPGNDIAKFEESPIACATLDIYEDLDYEGDMEFSVLLVDVLPLDVFGRGNIQTDFLIHDPGGETHRHDIVRHSAINLTERALCLKYGGIV